MKLPHSPFDQVLGAYPHPFVFVTLSGAHLYGFPSVDSDFDLRGSHLLPGDAFWGLSDPRMTDEPQSDSAEGLVEVVTHDLKKFAGLLLKRNGYVLEQLTSPIVVRTSPVHAQLLDLVPGILTRNHYHHYRGFYHTERKEYDRSPTLPPKGDGQGDRVPSGQPSIKKLLYCFRVLMTGIVLLREAQVEANLLHLNQRFDLPFIDELVRIKASAEWGGVPDNPEYLSALDQLEAEMDRAFTESWLPEAPPARADVERLVVEARRELKGAS